MNASAPARKVTNDKAGAAALRQVRQIHGGDDLRAAREGRNGAALVCRCVQEGGGRHRDHRDQADPSCLSVARHGLSARRIRATLGLRGVAEC